MSIDIVILAAGQGTRMRSALPKVLHPIAGTPMLAHVLAAAQALGNVNLHVVIGHGADQVKAAITSDAISWVEQKEQLGTGHAMQQALPSLTAGGKTLILYGDVPLIQTSTLQELLEVVDEKQLGLLTAILEDPTGYGRIVRDSDKRVAGIVEHKDATSQQHEITEVNTGIMAVPTDQLTHWLSQLSNDNAQSEYYLTDIIAMAVDQGVEVTTKQPQALYEVQGINSREQQAEVERAYQNMQAQQLLQGGVTLADPSRFDCRGVLTCGQDVAIDINCVFEGEVTIGNGVVIEPNCVIKDSVLGDGVRVCANTVIEAAQVANNCVLGPYARLRPGTVLSDDVKIGNFVETKQAQVGAGSKVNHLSYIGDTEIGSDSNVGAGTITCNYDGANKHKTRIGDNAFIGSNTALVAPVVIGAGATVAAGSTIGKDVKENQLGITRSPQKNIDGWVRPTKDK